MKRLNPTLIAIFFVLFSFSSFAQTSLNPWTFIHENTIDPASLNRTTFPSAYLTAHLNVEDLNNQLSLAPERKYGEQMPTSETILKLPMSDGNFSSFIIYNAPILHPDLAARYPMIRSYVGLGIDDPTAYARFDQTENGFHGMILSARHSTVYIDPYDRDVSDNYIVYYKKDSHNDSEVQCLAEHPETPTNNYGITDSELTTSLIGDCQIRKYRLAVACTGEYAQFHGGTVSNALAAINNTMTRVIGIFERDLSITMEIIANNDEIVFLDENTDPYTNDDAATMRAENAQTLSDVIGENNYDIGHVFRRGNGGTAFLTGVCLNGAKGAAVSGEFFTNEDIFVTSVAHEMGHQFGANHTQNNDCQRSDATVEPGSGSTIMGYPGVCSPNVQSFKDDYFHAYSLQEMNLFAVLGQGNSCAEIISTNNSQPSVDAGEDYTIPISTPFTLTAIAQDDNPNGLTYSWEQMDTEIATMPPQSTNTDGPAFRSYQPEISPSRTFPNINAIINNTNPTWEVLPSVSRNMTFNVTVRDNTNGNGCTTEDEMTITTTSSAGPFLVETPNTNVTWLVGDDEIVAWDVANTNAAPINCSFVNILLSTDGGVSYDIVLASNTPNDGSANIIIPNNIGNTNRIRVACADNVFFDISNTDFTIEAPQAPTFLLSSTPTDQLICVGETGTYELSLSSIAGFDEEITFEALNLPEGFSVSFSPENITPSGNVSMTISNNSSLTGEYTFDVVAVSESLNRMLTINIESVNGNFPEILTTISPASGASGTSITPTISWESIANATSYFVEVANNPSFSAIIASTTTADLSYTTSDLQNNIVYYWRVQPINGCGNGAFSAISSFQTEAPECFLFSSTDVPVGIPINAAGTFSSTLNIPNSMLITDVNMIDLEISHTWVTDLEATLVSPSGTSVLLFDMPGFPFMQPNPFGCFADNILTTFDDEATLSAAIFETSCDFNAPYAISGTYQSLENLSDYNDEDAQGIWTLNVSDALAGEGGQLESWSLQICQEIVPAEEIALVNEVLDISNGENAAIENTILAATVAQVEASQITFTILSLPQNGGLLVNGIPASVGTTFTQTDIDNGSLIYENNGTTASADSFLFDVVTSDGSWSSNNTFSIEIILNNTIAATAVLDNDISCHNADDAQITVSATGGNGELTYSINGANFQDSPIFSDLTEGEYTITVMDEAGFTFETTIILINNPTAINASASVNNREITITASGGTGNLQYSLDDIMYQSSNIFSDISNGLFTIYVQDENGCITTTTALINIASLVSTAVVSQDVLCFGESSGEILASAEGGIPPYLYSLNGGEFQGNTTFSQLLAGEYTLTVQDAEGTETTTELTITTPEMITAETIVEDFMLTVNATGGTPPYQYGVDGTNFQPENEFLFSQNGIYLITILDNNGCLLETSATISVNTLVVLSTEITPINCALSLLSVVIEGGTSPYQYSLDGVSFQDSPDFEIAVNQNVIVMIRDAEGFEISTEEIYIPIPDIPILEASTENSSVTLSASEGTPDYLYSIDEENFQPSGEFTDLPDGNYTATVIDDLGCTASLNFTIMTTSSYAVQNNLQFEVNPNPSSGIFNIIINKETEKELKLDIFAIDGQLIAAKSFIKTRANFEYLVDLQHLPNGIYSIRLSSDKFIGHKRILIMK